MTLPAISPAHSVDGTVSEQPSRAGRSPSSVAPAVWANVSPADHRRIQEWLLLLLRFAITLDPNNEAATIAMADELDGLGLDWRPTAPTFFRRTSDDVCKAIATPDDPARTTVLRTHCARIDDRRLRRAFEAVVGLDGSLRPPRRPRAALDLWAGLER
jgi:hypothetical protein